MPTIPAGSEVVSAQLYLALHPNDPNDIYVDGFQAFGPVTGEIHAVSTARPSDYITNYSWICNLK